MPAGGILQAFSGLVLAAQQRAWASPGPSIAMAAAVGSKAKDLYRSVLDGSQPGHHGNGVIGQRGRTQP